MQDLWKKVKSTIGTIVNSSPKTVSLEAMAVTARDLGIQVDEECQACQCARKYTEEITAEIRDGAKYKREMLSLQGDPWKNLAQLEKEMCQMKRQGDVAIEDYKSVLKQKWLEIRRQRNQCDRTNGLTKFINGIVQLNPVEKHYFLKWMKFSLDNIARGNLSEMWADYKEKCETPGVDRKQMEELDKLISIVPWGWSISCVSWDSSMTLNAQWLKKGKWKKAKDHSPISHAQQLT
ncbi:unnamed protein product [Caretta caretta]